MKTIFILLILFQIKHFLADYPLQNKFMLGKFKDKGWVWPLSAHCLVHSVMTFFIAIYFADFITALIVAFIDFVLHFVMDRIKASSKLLGRFECLPKGEFKGLSESYSMVNEALITHYKMPIEDHMNILRLATIQKERIEKRFKSNTYFWWSLGLDQAIHHLTHYLIIYLLIRS